LSEKLKEADNEQVRHGGLLGLGLATISTGQDSYYELMKEYLMHDDAVTGEAAGIAIGLMCLGSGNARAVDDLTGYASETSHDKIRRGCAIGMAMVHFGAPKPNVARQQFQKLALHKEGSLRAGAAAMLGILFIYDKACYVLI